ncbi:terpene synthase family protein [Planosporangium sp. 12N6]|uniref:terpene synthase family protein n=1 Tax=Planosporangium spinosum TaxID=3402278 RepID=UPI003CE6935D
MAPSGHVPGSRVPSPAGGAPLAGDAPPAGAPAVPAPAVLCPFPPRISPHALRLQRYADGWATRHGFLPTVPARAAFSRARFAYLMARAYPDADYADLRLAVSWLTFTFALDDQLETVLGRSPDRQRNLAERLVGYLAGDHAAHGLEGPLATALADVWGRTLARTGPAWRERFVSHVGQYLAGNAWEADNRSQGRVPSVAEYVRMRRHTAATAMFFDLVEAFTDGREASTGPGERGTSAGSGGAGDRSATPDDRAALAPLRRHADNAVAWFNDLVSWPKEAAGGDPHNLVLVVRHERDRSLADAVREVTDRHDREVRAFLAARDVLPDRPAVRRAATGLAHWIRANVDWSHETGRYAPADPRG